MQGVEAFRSGLRGRWLRRGGQWNEEVLEPQMVKELSDVTPKLKSVQLPLDSAFWLSLPGED